MTHNSSCSAVHPKQKKNFLSVKTQLDETNQARERARNKSYSKTKIDVKCLDFARSTSLPISKLKLDELSRVMLFMHKFSHFVLFFVSWFWMALRSCSSSFVSYCFKFCILARHLLKNSDLFFKQKKSIKSLIINNLRQKKHNAPRTNVNILSASRVCTWNTEIWLEPEPAPELERERESTKCVYVSTCCWKR